ncbi:formin-like protein 7 [Lotus japonicus]|uniref:formin-like protein 7 n=1 Tax=Lotus japonicus TaxID=34305 RepID=UPI002584A2B0|nr:formin-like protein 7 [Lotus japonicus]
MASPFLQERQEPQEDWLALSLSLPYSSSPLPPPPPPPPPAPQPFPFQYIPRLLRAPSPPRPAPFQFIPLPPPPPSPMLLPIQFMYTRHYQEPYFPAPPPYMPPQEPNTLVPKDGSPSQEESSSGEAQHSRRPQASSSNPPPPRAARRRRDVRSETVPPPFPWATSKRAIVHSLEHLRSQGVTEITGTVTCKRCDEQRDITFNLEEKFSEVARFIEENRFDLHDRAPAQWSNPVLPTCERCGTENSLKPVITKKRSINWLFLLLGQMVGCCKLEQLKYFCKHAMNHRTGAKDRLLYSTYIGLCKQLHPEGPYE